MPAPQRKIHITNSKGRNAPVGFSTLKAPAPPGKGVVGKSAEFIRFLAAAPENTHAKLTETQGDAYGQALVDGDPEVDMERVGQRLGRMSQVYLSSEGNVLHAPPSLIEVILDPSGAEKERKAWEDKQANVNDEFPIRWTGKKMPKKQALQRFVFERSIQLSHFNGLTYDYLFGIAEELANDDALMLVGGGEKGRDPLVFNTNGAAFRGFLEGRVEGTRYQLLLHLSRMELKRPETEKKG